MYPGVFYSKGIKIGMRRYLIEKSGLFPVLEKEWEL